MKNQLGCIFILLMTAISISNGREVSGTGKFENYRPLGEIRLWTFVIKDSTLGTLTSTVKEKTEVDDVDGYIIEEKLQLDYQKIGSSLKMNIESKHYVASEGFYLGDKMKLSINDEKEEMELKRSGKELIGYITRGGKKIKQAHSFKVDGFAMENNFLDQYELFLAMRDIKVGDIIEDTIFMPQSMIKAKVQAVVEDFINLRVYDNVYDSAFVIHYTEPREQYHYFTPDKRLIKAEIPSQDVKVYLDRVQRPPPPATRRIFLDKSIRDIVIVYLIYLLMGTVSLVFFIKQGYRWPISYVSLFIGGLMFIAIVFTQIPIQYRLTNNVFIPRVKLGGSPYVWGWLPALTAGVIQEILKALSITVITKLSRSKSYMYTVIGAMCGVGFGIVEACYLVGGADTAQLFSISLVERGFMILFHTTSGALLGYALSQGVWKLGGFLVLTAAVNSTFRYLPIFVQYKAATVEILNLLLAFISIGILLFAMLLFKKIKNI